MMDDKKIYKYIEDYKSREIVYLDFTNTIKSILETLLKENGFKYQISSRPKSLISLERKLREDKKISDIESVEEIDDLAGCRIIFYLESDIERFAKYLYHEFDAVKTNLKYSPDDYNASHLVVRLDKDRLKLTEYSKFKNLKCEIQLTTVLYHAWSEMAHPIIYKPEEKLSEFDQHTFNSLKKQFSDVMRNHIKQASYSFEFIYKQFEKIKQGKKVFDIEFLEGITELKSNNEIYENLKLLYQYIQEFGDKTPEELDIISIIESVLEKSKVIKSQPIKTVIGDFKGYSYPDIAIICLDILNQIKYFHAQKAFYLIVRLSRDSDFNVKKKALEILEGFSKYNSNILEKIGYYPQLVILTEIEKWDNKNLIDNFESVIEITKQLLQPSFEGHSMKDYKTVTFLFGPLPVNDQLKNIRGRVMNLLKKLYSISDEIEEKKRIVNALQAATHIPPQGKYGEDMEQMILDDTNSLIDYYIKILTKASFEIMKDIEEQVHWFIRRFGKEKLPQIDQLQSIITSNTEYEIFRILIGYDYKFSKDLDWSKSEKIRKDKIQEFIGGFSKENFEEWQKRILLIRDHYSLSNASEFHSFNIFLFELGKQKPELALKLIKQNENDLEPFLTHLVAGIWKSKKQKSAKNIISTWINEERNLPHCAYIFDLVEEIDVQLIKKICKKAKDRKDIQALNYIISSIVKNYKKYRNLDQLFVETISEITKNDNFLWVYNIWYRGELILGSLSKENLDIFLGNLILIPYVDFHCEAILLPIAERYPKKVIHFFERRIDLQSKKGQNGKYDAVPFELFEINKPLQKHSKIAVPEILKWFSKKHWLFQWEACHLLQAIFPSFNSILEKALLKLINKGGKKNAKIVLSVLRAYKGEQFLHKICHEFIKKYSKNEKYKKEIFIILSQTGIVTGEYGFVDVYERKRKEVEYWKKDKSKAIQSFIKEYDNYLNVRILYEKKRADEYIEMSERDFNY